MKPSSYLLELAIAEDLPHSVRMTRFTPTVLSMAGAFLALMASGCGDRQSTPAAAQNPISPSPPVPLGPALTGVVFQTTEDGRRPLPGARVFVVDLVEGPYGNYPWTELRTDSNGRYSRENLFAGRAVKVTAYSGTGSGLWNQSGLYQTCAVHPTLDGDTAADIELVQAGVLPATYGSPTLAGVVFETSQGRRPVGGASVMYTSFGHDGADVYAQTDANGRYAFCGLPLGRGLVLAGCTGGAVTPTPGFRYAQAPIEIRGDTVLDVDITSAMSSCE